MSYMKLGHSSSEKSPKLPASDTKGKYVMTLVTKSAVKQDYPYHDGQYPYYDWAIHFQPKDKRWPPLALFVDKIVVTLHPSFTPVNRILLEPPYTITEKGWGEFEMTIKILFKDRKIESLLFSHELHFLPFEEVDIPLPIDVAWSEEFKTTNAHKPKPSISSAAAITRSTTSAVPLSSTLVADPKIRSSHRQSSSTGLSKQAFSEPTHPAGSTSRLASSRSREQQMNDAALERLAQRLCSLDSPAVKKVTQTVQGFKSVDARFSDGLFSFDLYCLSQEQLSELSSLVHFEP